MKAVFQVAPTLQWISEPQGSKLQMPEQHAHLEHSAHAHVLKHIIFELHSGMQLAQRTVWGRAGETERE